MRDERTNPAELRRPFMVETKGSENMASQALAPAEVTSLSGGLLTVIERASRDPSVDIDKMERLIALQERVLTRQAEESFHTALAELQPLLPVITERGKIIHKDGNKENLIGTYAYWEDINEAIRPLLAERGFSLTFRVGRAGSDIAVTGKLSRQGHSEETTLTLPADGSGKKNAVQALGSSLSYAKRYVALSLLNITTRGEDDDAETATKYKADGEPMPRAKLDGPHTSKTALRTAVHEIISKVRAAQSNEEIDQIIRESKETRKQAEKDWPALVNGDPKVPEDVGLRGAVEVQRAALSEDGMVPGMIRSMKECDTKPSLENWRIANEDAIEALDGAESRTFQLAYDLHESRIQAMDTVSAGA